MKIAVQMETGIIIAMTVQGALLRASQLSNSQLRMFYGTAYSIK